MTSARCTPIVDEILSQLGHQFSVEEAGAVCTLHTPFLYPDNTPISVYIANAEHGEIEISDHGQASDFAFVSGVGQMTVTSRIKRVGRRFRMSNDKDELIIRAEQADVGSAIVSMITAVQDIGYLVYRQPSVARKREFVHEVERFLVQNGRSYERDVIVTGRARMRKVDFRVQGDGYRQLDLFILDSAAPSAAESRADTIAMTFRDAYEKWSDAPQFAVLVNTAGTSDGESPLAPAIRVLEEFVPNVFLWESRHGVTEMLTAA